MAELQNLTPQVTIDASEDYLLLLCDKIFKARDLSKVESIVADASKIRFGLMALNASLGLSTVNSQWLSPWPGDGTGSFTTFDPYFLEKTSIVFPGDGYSVYQPVYFLAGQTPPPITINYTATPISSVIINVMFFNNTSEFVPITSDTLNGAPLSGSHTFNFTALSADAHYIVISVASYSNGANCSITIPTVELNDVLIPITTPNTYDVDGITLQQIILGLNTLCKVYSQQTIPQINV